jgi:hypothetical protein
MAMAFGINKQSMVVAYLGPRSRIFETKTGKPQHYRKAHEGWLLISTDGLKQRKNFWTGEHGYRLCKDLNQEMTDLVHLDSLTSLRRSYHSKRFKKTKKESVCK